MLHAIGLLVAGREYPLLPVGWRGGSNAAPRWHGLLWLLPAGYFLAGPPVLFSILHRPSIAISVMTILILGSSVWAGLMAWSILSLRERTASDPGVT